MREFTINVNDAGLRLDKFISKAVPKLPNAMLQKSIRLKKIKINGKRAYAEDRLTEGDILTLYLNDEFFVDDKKTPAYLVTRPRLNILYEDKNILLVDKKPGVSVHEDSNGAANTLIAQIQAYLLEKGDWSPERENAFAPALCNRIDRNTGGIVIAAKNAQSLRIMNEKIKEREIKKFYLCIVHGELNPPAGQLEGYLFKDAVQNRVYVRAKPQPGAKTAVTLYKTVKVKQGLSLVECELVTGRTHQIRAQMSAAGHPLLGDGKYGINRDNKPYHRNGQALYSYRLVFAFRTPAGILEYLKGRHFEVDNVDFAQEYFE